MATPKKRRPQTVTMTLRKDGTILMRSTGGLDLRPFLSSCPFCGGTGDSFSKPDPNSSPTGFWWTILCNDGCLAEGPMARTEELAIAAWNTRALSTRPATEVKATHRHKKRGTEYVLLGIGKMQAQWWYEPAAPHGEMVNIDMREVAIYRSATDPNEIWVRPREEFEDDRFIALTSTAKETE